MTLGPNPDARSVANERVRAFLREQLAAPAAVRSSIPAASAATTTQ